MTYKVTNITIRQTSKGDDYKQCDLVDTAGVAFQKVPYWSSLPNYANIEVGTTIEGSITSSQNGQYTNHKLSLAGAPQRSVGGMGAGMMKAKTEAIKEAQSNKEHSIGKAQDRNEVMYAKKSAAEIIAHHPAYKDLNNLNLPQIFKNLTDLILNYNPKSKLTAGEVDTLTTKQMVEHSTSFQNAVDSDDGLDGIDPADIPF